MSPGVGWMISCVTLYVLNEVSDPLFLRRSNSDRKDRTELYVGDYC